MEELPAILRIQDWHAADATLEYERIKNSDGFEGAMWLNDGALSPKTLYCYLKGRFGEPRGGMSLLRSPTSDNLFQWQFNVTCDDDLLCILSSNSRVQFRAHTRNRLTVGQQTELLRDIREDFAQHGRLISKTRASLERWLLITNPYARVERAVAEFHAELSEITIAAYPKQPLMFDSEQDVRSHIRAMDDWMKRQGRVATLGTAIRMLAPVLAESFVNLTIFALAKPELKRDSRLLDHALRAQIDVRVKRLHLDCHGFRTAIAVDSQEFRDFHSLMNRRNQVLHGNVDPRQLKVDQVFFDGTVPVFEKEQDFLQRVGTWVAAEVDPDAATRDIACASLFIEHVMDCLDPAVQEQLRALMELDHFGYREDTGRVGVLFASPFVGEMMGVAGSRGEE